MGARGASSSFSMGQGFGADLIESDDGALQMRVSGFDGPPVRIEVMNLMGHRGAQSRGGRSQQGSSDERADMRSFLSDMMPGSLVSSHLNGLRATTPNYVHPRGARPSGSSTNLIGIGSSSPYPVTHPLLKVSDPGQARLLQNAGTGRAGSSTSSSGIFGAISSAIRERGLHGHDDVRQARLSVSTRRRALGPIVSDRRWGTDIGEVEVVGSRLPSLLVTVESALFDQIEAPKEKEKEKARKEKVGVSTKALSGRRRYLHGEEDGESSGSEDEFLRDDSLMEPFDPLHYPAGDDEDEDGDEEAESEAELYDDADPSDHNFAVREEEECKEEGELEETKEGDDEDEGNEEKEELLESDDHAPSMIGENMPETSIAVTSLIIPLSSPPIASSTLQPASTVSEIQEKDDSLSNSLMSTDEPVNSTTRSIMSDDVNLSVNLSSMNGSDIRISDSKSSASSSSSESVITSNVTETSVPIPILVPLPVPVPMPIVSGIFPGVSDEVWVALPFEMQTELLVSIGMQAEADALLDAEITATGM